MGLIARAGRLRYVWSWRARYWWLDTRSGEAAHWVCVCLGALVSVVQVARMFMAAAVPPAAGEPAKAVYWWVVQLIIAIIAAIVAYKMRPKVEPAKPASGTQPTVEDGQSVKHYFGTCWIEDEFLLAWKQMGTIPIKTKGGKK
ncbi:hypothetical protein [Lysobacter olei]